MLAPARNAYYVVGLVLRQSITRTYASTATLLRDVIDNETDLDSENAPVSFDFLEAASSEYEEVSIVLPHRTYRPQPIPWPTILAPRPTSDPILTEKARPCDGVVRKVLEDEFSGARVLAEELLATRQHVRHRAVYLNTALTRLETNDTNGFLFWLSLYPNRPAMRNHNDLKATWLPLVYRLIHERTHDTRLLSEFLRMTGKKGLLPTVYAPLMSHIQHITSPEDSFDISGRAIEAYRISTTSLKSESYRAKAWRELVSKQISNWWNKYLRGLISAGWVKAAGMLFHSNIPAAKWDEHTRKMAREELESLERQYSDLPDVEAGEYFTAFAQSSEQLGYRQDPMNMPEEDVDNRFARNPMSSPSADLPLTERIRQAAQSGLDPAPLADLLQTLNQDPKCQPILDLFHQAFCRLDESGGPHNRSNYRARTWIHAEIISHLRKGDDQSALRIYQERFLWYGLPDHPFRHQSFPGKIQPLPIKPTIHLSTTLIPSLLRTLPQPLSSSIPSFHSSYLTIAQHLPPSSKPTAATHGTFLRQICHHLGPDIGIAAMRNIVGAGFQPGRSACTAVVLSFAGRGRFEEMLELLGRMEDGEGRMERPVERDYEALVGILGRKGEFEIVEKVLRGRDLRLGREDPGGGVEVLDEKVRSAG